MTTDNKKTVQDTVQDESAGLTTDSKREYVKGKCIESNPSIKDLVFGCEVKGFSTALGRTFLLEMFDDPDELWGRMSVYPENWKDYRSEPVYTASWKKPSKKDFEIIGRKIGLADVLLVIEKNGIEIEMNVYGDIFHIGHYEKPNKEGYYSKSFWSLSQDFDHQSQELYDFLYELLHG